jgi:predicted ATPase
MEQLGFISHLQLLESRIEANDAFPFALPAVNALRRKFALHPRATFFVGENGTGKSTLIEGIAMALGFNAEGGSQHFNFSTRPSESSLHKALRIARTERRPRTGFFLRAESFFNVATTIEELDREPAPAPPIIDSYGGKSLHAQSHGEAFLALARHRFGPDGLYILDEPEAALSPTKQLALLARLHDLVNEGSQLIIATHSPILMALPGAQICLLSERGIADIRYEDTEHYQVTKRFLVDKERVLRDLFDTR